MSEGTKQSHKLQIEFSQSVKNGLTQTLSLTSKLLTKTLSVKIERKIYCWKKKIKRQNSSSFKFNEQNTFIAPHCNGQTVGKLVFMR